MKEFEPELGQALFGQPYKRYEVSPLLERALMTIDTLLFLKAKNKNYNSPFSNSGNSFHCDIFSVDAYSWDDDVDQPWNFKWQDVEVSWYKYLGRGMSVNKILSKERIKELVNDCSKAIDSYTGGDL